MRINHNIMAINTHRSYSINNANVAKSSEKLSSGYRINRAGDDAAGLAISEKMRAQIRGLNMASKNSQDAISLVQTTEGALQEVHNILQRMRELAVQAASDTNDSKVDRKALDLEVQQLKEEITAVSEVTTFNGIGVLKPPSGIVSNYKIQSGPNATDVLNMNINGLSLANVGSPIMQTQPAAPTIPPVAPGALNYEAIGGTTATAADTQTAAAPTVAGTMTKEDAQKILNYINANSVDTATGVTYTSGGNVDDFSALEGLIAGLSSGQTLADLGADATDAIAALTGLVTNAAVDVDAAAGGVASDYTAIAGTKTIAAGDPLPPAAISGTTDASSLTKMLEYLKANNLGGGMKFTGTIANDVDSMITAIQAAASEGKTLDAAGFAAADIADLTALQKLAQDGLEAKFVNDVNSFAKDVVQFTIQTNNVINFYKDAAYPNPIDTTFTLAADATSATTLLTGDIETMLSAAKAFLSDLDAGNIVGTAGSDATTPRAVDLSSISVSTRVGASFAITKVNDAVNSLSLERAQLGAYQNRLEHKIANLDTSAENLQAAESRIRDVDMAKEMTEFTKNNILSQAATAMLAQANSAPQGVLQLLK